MAIKNKIVVPNRDCEFWDLTTVSKDENYSVPAKTEVEVLNTPVSVTSPQVGVQQTLTHGGFTFAASKLTISTPPASVTLAQKGTVRGTTRGMVQYRVSDPTAFSTIAPIGVGAESVYAFPIATYPTDWFFNLVGNSAVNSATSWIDATGKTFVANAALTVTPAALNGNSVVNLSGGRFLDFSATAFNINAATVFAVCVAALPSTGAGRIVSNSALGQSDFSLSGGWIPLYRSGSNAVSLRQGTGDISPVALSTSAYKLYSHRLHPSLGMRNYVNNTAGALQAFTVNRTFDKWSIGVTTNSIGDSRFNGIVAEVIYFTRYLSDTEHSAVSSFLISKYNLS